MYNLEEIENYIRHCHRCALATTRHKAVAGMGNRAAKILFVGEAPGAREDESGIPFVGKAGKMFDELLNGCALKRSEIYLTNVIKCRPPLNREPKAKEIESCFPFLKYETYLLKPRIIVCLGRIAAQRIIAPDFKITKQRGIWFERKGCALFATFHPSALLRDPSKIPLAAADFRLIVQKYRELD